MEKSKRRELLIIINSYKIKVIQAWSDLVFNCKVIIIVAF